MSKTSRRKSGKKSRKEELSLVTDITLHDYADASGTIPVTQRIKKGAAASSLKKALLLTETLGQQQEQLDNGYDKDLNDYLTNGISEEEEGERYTESEASATTRKHKNKHTHKKETNSDCGIIYPYDVWHMIAQYISPEDVGTFACVCSHANKVVHWAYFWRQLYHRHYQQSESLPKTLLPRYLYTAHGLRARVIRALYFTYPPLVCRIKNSMANIQDLPCGLEGQNCICQWHVSVKNIWNFYFKFRKNRLKNSLLSSKLTNSSHTHDIINGYDDIFYNSEDNCTILHVVCQNFMSTPVVTGLVLTKVFLNVSQGMRHHRLKLIFDTLLKSDRSCSGSESVLILDPVISFHVMPWWHPKYPCFN